MIASICNSYSIDVLTCDITFIKMSSEPKDKDVGTHVKKRNRDDVVGVVQQNL